MTNGLLLNMAIEIVSFPTKNGGLNHSDVKLPDGKSAKSMGAFRAATNDQRDPEGIDFG